MAYDLNKIAEELTVERGDLLVVLSIFFEEAEGLIAEAKKAYEAGDWNTLTQKLHALKGSSANLRLEKLNSLAVKLDDGAKTRKNKVIENLLPIIEQEIGSLKKAAL